MVALLGKQYGVRPPGWREAADGYGPDGAFRSVADIVDGESPAKVRAYKKAMKGLTGPACVDFGHSRATVRGWIVDLGGTR
jgi:uncharacterized HhH-GPD family protein